MKKLKKTLALAEIHPKLNTPIFNLVPVLFESEKIIALVPNKFVRDIVVEKKDLIEKLTGKKLEIRVESSSQLSNTGVSSRVDECVKIKRTGFLIGDMLSHELTPANYIVAENNVKAQEAIEWLINTDQGELSLTIYGPPGVGKTHLLQATAWRCIYSGIDVAYFSSSTLVNLFMSSFKSNLTDNVRYMISEAKILFIDDFQIFNQKPLEAVRNALFVLIEHMLSSGRKIIVTSDVKPDEHSWRYIQERTRQRVTLYGAVPIYPPGKNFVKRFLEKRLMKYGAKIDEKALNLVTTTEFKSVRQLHSLVLFFISKRKKFISEEDMLAALIEILGTKVNLGIRNNLLELWHIVVDSFFDMVDSQAIKSGETKLRGEKKKLLSYLKIAFASIAVNEKGIATTEVAEVLDTTYVTVYRWLKKESDLKKEVFYRAVRAKVFDVINKIMEIQN